MGVVLSNEEIESMDRMALRDAIKSQNRYVEYMRKCVVDAQDKHDRVLKDLGSCQRQLLFIVNAAKEACHGDLVMRPDDLECIRQLKMALTILEDNGE